MIVGVDTEWVRGRHSVYDSDATLDRPAERRHGEGARDLGERRGRERCPGAEGEVVVA
jgi:hypothetical protein